MKEITTENKEPNSAKYNVVIRLDGSQYVGEVEATIDFIDKFFLNYQNLCKFTMDIKDGDVFMIGRDACQRAVFVFTRLKQPNDRISDSRANNHGL